MKPIADAKQRRVTYNKRKRGLLKKAIELSTLCETDILMVILDKKNRSMVEFNSKSDFKISAVNTLNKKMYQYEMFQNEDYRALENCISE